MECGAWDLLCRSAQSQKNAGESQSSPDAERDANGRISVRPLLVMDGNNRLPVGIGNEDFEVEGSRNGLIADHAGREAVLAYSGEDACVHTGASSDGVVTRPMAELMVPHSEAA